MQRLTTMGKVVPTGMAYRFSPLKGRMVLYSKCQAIAACEPFEYPLDQLRDAYNRELEEQEVDAYVESCKQLRGTFQDDLIVDCWVSTESPIAPAIVSLIIFILYVTAITVAGLLLLSAATAFVETLKGKPPGPFYAPDGTAFNDLAAYVTYMANIYNPAQGKPYTCMYCGQGFATAEERDTHQAQCPWKEGPPTYPDDFIKTALVIVTILGAVYVISKIL